MFLTQLDMVVPACWCRFAGMVIKSHFELRIFQESLALALEIQPLVNGLPDAERYLLGDQAPRSSRAPAALIAEGFRKRHYPLVFKNKLLEAEGEAAETQVWLCFMRDFGYAPKEKCDELIARYDKLLVSILNTRLSAHEWVPDKKPRKRNNQNDDP